jgi:hypothetical protein
VRVLVSLHRWLGVAFCVPLALWFATGIVMHFVPFPSPLGEAERLTGIDLDLARVKHGPAEAVAATRSRAPTRVRLIERADGPIYLVTSPAGVKAVRAGDLADGALRSEQSALSVAATYAGGRGLDFARAAVAGLAAYDQWTVAGEYDPHRPLYRLALNDGPATELYVSSTTGEVVLETTRHVRGWNYLGSVVHWIYFTGVRSHAAAWRALLWSLSFLALIGVAAGAIVGPSRLKIEGRRVVTPFDGWQAWHHWLGLICMPFIFTWMFSGWLSMDDGLLFSSGKLAPAEITALIGQGRGPAYRPMRYGSCRRRCGKCFGLPSAARFTGAKLSLSIIEDRSSSYARRRSTRPRAIGSVPVSRLSWSAPAIAMRTLQPLRAAASFASSAARIGSISTRATALSRSSTVRGAAIAGCSRPCTGSIGRS